MVELLVCLISVTKSAWKRLFLCIHEFDAQNIVIVGKTLDQFHHFIVLARW